MCKMYAEKVSFLLLYSKNRQNKTKFKKGIDKGSEDVVY